MTNALYQRVWTLPNALSFLRAAGIPLFLWLILVKENAPWAIAVLTAAGISDYLDGKLARALHQESRLGELLDPAVDRLYIASTLIALYLTGAIELWLLLLLFTRDIWLGVLLLYIRRFGVPPFTVTYLGKAATFNLLYAFPFLLLTNESSGRISDIAFVIAWGFSGWGIALYLWTAVTYTHDGLRLVSETKTRGTRGK